jgi:hypothetical protein
MNPNWRASGALLAGVVQKQAGLLLWKCENGTIRYYQLCERLLIGIGHFMKAS